MLQTANALGIGDDEVFVTPMLAEFRTKIDYFRAIVWEGTLPETTQSEIEQLVYRLFSVAGGGLMAGAIAKFKQHKNNPQQVHAGQSPGATLFDGGCNPCQIQ